MISREGQEAAAAAAAAAAVGAVPTGTAAVKRKKKETHRRDATMLVACNNNVKCFEAALQQLMQLLMVDGSAGNFCYPPGWDGCGNLFYLGLWVL